MAVALRALVLAGVIAVLVVTRASGQCYSSTLIQLDVPGVTTFYYDERSEPPPPSPPTPVPAFWLYEEANAQQGLQRGGAQWLLDMLGQSDLDREICIESTTPDRLWF